MANQKKKKRFKVEENESISDCLERMKTEGYTPVRRSEVPVWKEENGTRTVSHQQIEFEGRRIEE
ncbi:NETI motif-containing protein [Salinicoccus sp. YB14-2]|uniref:NETI motif-containing protein n=1 Tax=Salinicoccus sp. YB14-2 TaxID=1572701 RepID=UPI00069147BE|nr:NETI motif-containing protein [Salinicoccus sp. YB14-2]